MAVSAVPAMVLRKFRLIKIDLLVLTEIFTDLWHHNSYPNFWWHGSAAAAPAAEATNP